MPEIDGGRDQGCGLTQATVSPPPANPGRSKLLESGCDRRAAVRAIAVGAAAVLSPVPRFGPRWLINDAHPWGLFMKDALVAEEFGDPLDQIDDEWMFGVGELPGPWEVDGQSLEDAARPRGEDDDPVR